MLTNKELSIICDYVSMNDRHSDMDGLMSEYINEEISYQVVYDCLKGILEGWKEEILLNGIKAKEKWIFDKLGIEY